MILLRERDVELSSAIASVFSSTSGRPGKARGDLGRALEVQAVVVAHAIVIAAILAEADAEQHVVRVVIVVAEEVRVVRRDDRKSQSPARARRRSALSFACIRRSRAPGPRGSSDPGRRWHTSSPLLSPLRSRPSSRCVAISPAMHAEETMMPFGVLREQLAVDAGLGVEALGVGQRRELDEVL